MPDQDANAPNAPTGSASRALVLASAPVDEPLRERPTADFLAQLIACERRLPAYRAARLAEPRVAICAYGERAELSKARLDCSV